MNTIKRQRGASMFGWVLIISMVVVIGTAALKLMPAYIEYYTIKGVVKSVQEDPEMQNATKRDIISAVKKRFDINDVGSVTADDLKLTKVKDKRAYLLEIEYQVTKKLFGNISIVVDFQHSAEFGAEVGAE